MKNKEYNLTNLDVYGALERKIAHRDWYAHLFRFTHALKLAKIGMNILDVGCGPAELLETLYRNRYKPKQYIGLEFRKQEVEKAKELYKDLDFAKFIQCDIVKDDIKNLIPQENWDIITCFEVAEHILKKNVVHLLQNIYNCCSDSTIVLISTPIFDPVVGPADNHVINGEIGEMTHEEFKELILNAGFKIKGNYATFCSIKDYKNKMDDQLKQTYEKLHEYYDVNVLSVLMAPLIDPKLGRNSLWQLTV